MPKPPPKDPRKWSQLTPVEKAERLGSKIQEILDESFQEEAAEVVRYLVDRYRYPQQVRSTAAGIATALDHLDQAIRDDVLGRLAATYHPQEAQK